MKLPLKIGWTPDRLQVRIPISDATGKVVALVAHDEKGFANFIVRVSSWLGWLIGNGYDGEWQRNTDVAGYNRGEWKKPLVRGGYVGGPIKPAAPTTGSGVAKP